MPSPARPDSLKRRRGHPGIDPEGKPLIGVHLKITESQSDRVKVAAKEDGTSVNEWIRTAIDDRLDSDSK